MSYDLTRNCRSSRIMLSCTNVQHPKYLAKPPGKHQGELAPRSLHCWVSEGLNILNQVFTFPVVIALGSVRVLRDCRRNMSKPTVKRFVKGM